MWRDAPLFADLRSPQTGGACTRCSAYDACRGGCMAAKFFTGLPMDGPDPECVRGLGEEALAGQRDKPRPTSDHSKSQRSAASLAYNRMVFPTKPPKRLCDESPI